MTFFMVEDTKPSRALTVIMRTVESGTAIGGCAFAIEGWLNHAGWPPMALCGVVAMLGVFFLVMEIKEYRKRVAHWQHYGDRLKG